MKQNDNKTTTEINYYLQAFEDELPDIDVLLDRLSIGLDPLDFEDELPDIDTLLMKQSLCLDEMFSNSE